MQKNKNLKSEEKVSEMKFGFVIPVLKAIDVKKKYAIIEEVCSRNKLSFDVIFAFNGNANSSFTEIRKDFSDYDNVSAFKVDMNVDEHRLITVAMKYCEGYDATIIYSAKDEIDDEVLQNFINSWKSGNKIVYLKKKKKGFKGFLSSIKEFFYKLGIKILNVFTDFGGELDIQLLDQEVVRTINQLPGKNRQLRVLDSFVGYNTDIITADLPETDGKEYNSKTKSYWVNLAVGLSLCALTLIFFLIGLIGSILGNLGVVTLIVFWALFLASGFMAYIFSVKTMLIHRVGEQVDTHEIKTLEDRAEKYNLKK